MLSLQTINILLEAPTGFGKSPVAIAVALTLAGLYSNDKDESNRQEQLFICPYCSKFKTTLEREYQRHIVLKHPGKPGYPNRSVIENIAYRL
jgi:hypothetical protein